MRYRSTPLVLLAQVFALIGTGVAATPATAPTAAVPCEVTVDGRVELICVLFRLAGNREYNLARIGPYEQVVEQHFGPHREHEAVKLARELARRGARYDAPMSLAVHLSPLPELAERVPFVPHPLGLDRRLAPEPTRRFLIAARQFAQEARFEQFLADQHEQHRAAVERMTRTLVDHACLEWFEPYFRAPRDGSGDAPPRFHLVVALLNGPSNYGAAVAAPDGQHLYCILGAWEQDRDGLATFGRQVVPVVVHEFAHSYVNPVVDRHLEALRPAGEKLFARTRDAMRAQAYGQWETMMRESIVRACVVRYRLANDGPLAAAGEIAEQSLRGFTWTGGLAQRLAEYESNRTRYPTLDSFMPRIVEFFDDYAVQQHP